jgi:hypothetical protein
MLPQGPWRRFSSCPRAQFSFPQNSICVSILEIHLLEKSPLPLIKNRTCIDSFASRCAGLPRDSAAPSHRNPCLCAFSVTPHASTAPVPLPAILANEPPVAPAPSPALCLRRCAAGTTAQHPRKMAAKSSHGRGAAQAQACATAVTRQVHGEPACLQLRWGDALLWGKKKGAQPGVAALLGAPGASYSSPAPTRSTARKAS